jgi:hypothetical protein
MSLIDLVAHWSAMLDDSQFLYSSLREKILEHLFIGELLRCLWRFGRRDIELLRAEVDFRGYDLALECNGCLRHIQLKSSHRGSAARSISAQIALEDMHCVLGDQLASPTALNRHHGG